MEINRDSRVTLRTWKNNDAAEAFEFYGDPEVSKLIGDGRPAGSVAEVSKILEKFENHQDRFGFSPWAVLENLSGKIVGICGLHTFNEAREPELGFRIARLFWGKGFATEASHLSLEYGFGKLALTQVSAITNPKNFATQKILSNTGFTLVGDTVIDCRRLLRFENHSSLVKNK
jgi:ribosomal-protein-alanine N-acetyltransferase